MPMVVATSEFGSCGGGGGSQSSCINHKCKLASYMSPLWRIVCAANTPNRWWIHLLEFHGEGLCFEAMTGYKNTLTSGSMNQAHTASRVFDGSEETAWISQCLDCHAHEAWVGLDFGRPVSVECVYIVQAERNLHQCSKIILQHSDNGIVWHDRYRYGFAGHTLRARTKLLADMDQRLNDKEDLMLNSWYAEYWRVMCVEEMRLQWGVKELAFYDNEGCSNGLTGGFEEILFSPTGSWPAVNAFDFDEASVWKSQCGVCVDPVTCDPCDVGEAYIGVRFKRSVNVQCMKIVQLEPGAGGCSRLYLQFKVSADRRWQGKATFAGVGGFAFLVPSRDDVSGALDQACGVASLVLFVSVFLSLQE